MPMLLVNRETDTATAAEITNTWLQHPFPNFGSPNGLAHSHKSHQEVAETLAIGNVNV